MPATNYALRVVDGSKPEALPVHDLTAEATVLSCLLTNPGEYALVSGMLTEQHFYFPPHATLYGALRTLAEQGTSLEVNTVLIELKRSAKLDATTHKTLHSIFEHTPYREGIEFFARVVVELSHQRELEAVLRTELVRCRTRHADVPKFLQETEARVSEASRRGTLTGGLVEIRIGMDRTMNKLLHGDLGLGLPTGFRDLDALTNGMRAKEMWVIASRPGCGKTSLALNIAVNMAQSKPDWASEIGVCFFSAEMSTEELSLRMLSSEASVDSERMGHGKKLSQDELNRVRDAAVWLSTLSVKIDDTQSFSLADLRVRAKRAADDWSRGVNTETGKPRRLSLIVVDYLQRIHPPRGDRSDRRQQVDAISAGLKNLAIELDIPVLVLAQLNRDIEKRPDPSPRMSDLRESGQIEQDADLILFLDKPRSTGEQAPKPHPKDPIVMQGHIGKFRRGAADVALPLKFEPPFTRFSDCNESEFFKV